MRPEEEINNAFLAAYADELAAPGTASGTGGTASGTATTGGSGTTPSGTTPSGTASPAAARRAPYIRLRRELYQQARTLQAYNVLFAIMLLIMLILLFRKR